MIGSSRMMEVAMTGSSRMGRPDDRKFKNERSLSDRELKNDFCIHAIFLSIKKHSKLLKIIHLL